MSLPPLPKLPCWYRRLPSRAVPLKLFQALYGDESSAFLYESLEARGGRGRYSFIGAKPRAVFTCRGQSLQLLLDGKAYHDQGHPLDALRKLIYVQSDAPPVAPFCGGAVGYLSYDTVRWTEAIPDENPDDLDVPDAHFLFPQEVICFDHRDKLLHVLLYQEDGQAQRLSEIEAALATIGENERPVRTATVRERSGAAGARIPSRTPAEPTMKSNMTKEQFEHMVERAKEYIFAGDIFQVVLSQRFEFSLTTPPLRLYQALRLTNPSPYMYYLKLDDLHIAGSSPEMLVTLSGSKVVTRPLAGTRRRGHTPEEDEALARELQTDQKERAEHVMLVDLGRNDLGRVCEYGSIELSDLLQIERHSKVMHLVSNVEGWLLPNRDALDLFQAVFPAGTVTGAPKVRAMQIIDELEPVRRGVYAGAIGYFSLLGDLDLCIAIRTIVMRGNQGFIQAGAGIVADSISHLEYKETLNKAHALMRAVQLANTEAPLA
ncbi:MAG: anthranilate synthase component I [Planctomycetes bacterium]|nr:anthranilate synthase component I [Planctomycetota bacterium]